ncbi:MAG: hypothetical protein ACK6AH_15460 [Gemmatimonadota bacterium]
MGPGITFARHFAQLVALLGAGQAPVEEQKLHLRAAAMATRGGAVCLRLHGGGLHADDSPVSPIFDGVRELTARFVALGLERLDARGGASPADLLVLARAIAAPATPGALAELLRTPPASVRLTFATDRAAIALEEVEGTPAAAEPPGEAVTAEPSVWVPAELPSEVVPAELPNEAVTAELPSEWAPAELPRVWVPAELPSEAVPAELPSEAVPAELPGADVPAPPSRDEPEAAALDAASLFHAVAGARTAREAVPGLLDALREPQSARRLGRILDELCTFVEVSQREGHFEDALHAYHGLVSAETSMGEAEARSALLLALRRLAKPPILDVVVRLAVRRAPADPLALAVLRRAGDEAVPAIVARVVAATSTPMREQLRHLVQLLPGAASGLGHTVLSARPVVARQAARFIADLGLGAADAALAQAVEQAAPEVRREALSALAALESPRAVDAHVRALRDGEITVRLQAVVGLVRLKPPGVVAVLNAALTDEGEPEAQVALVQAIGRVALPESVEPLVTAAEPAKGLFRRKSLALRVAAVHALAQLRMPGVSAVLQGLSQDKERAVRDALAQATRIHGRRTTRAMQAVQG